MDKFSIKKSYKRGHVGLRFSVTASAWNGGSIKIDGASDLSTENARDLAKALNEEADRADAKVAAEKAAAERRKKWRDREIAAGRMRVMSPSDFFGNPK